MDRTIIDKIRKGDEHAFELLFRKYYTRLCGFANKFLASRTDSEEIVQEVFLNIWKNRQKLKVNGSIHPYLFKSVQNLCFNFIAHQKVVDNYYSVIELVYQNSNQEFSAYEDVLYKELQDKIETTIQALPKECERIFRMSRDEGFKYAEIADRLGISVKTVETQISKALSKLKLELKDYITIVLINIFLNQ